MTKVAKQKTDPCDTHMPIHHCTFGNVHFQGNMHAFAVTLMETYLYYVSNIPFVFDFVPILLLFLDCQTYIVAEWCYYMLPEIDKDLFLMLLKYYNSITAKNKHFLISWLLSWPPDRLGAKLCSFTTRTYPKQPSINLVYRSRRLVIDYDTKCSVSCWSPGDEWRQIDWLWHAEHLSAKHDC